MTHALVTELLKTRSAYRLAKDLKASLGTVYKWKHGLMQPGPAYQRDLQELIDKEKLKEDKP